MWRAGPLWDCRNVAAESCVVHLVDEDTKESGGFFACVLLELGVDLGNEGGGDDGEQTSLESRSARIYPSNS